MYLGFRIGIVIPAFNEEKLISQVLEGVPSYIDRVYVVDDASTDTTRKEAKHFEGRTCLVLSHPSNLGVGASIITGYRKAVEDEMEIVVVMAGDNQMDPQHLPELLEPITRGEADYTKGDRLSRPGYQKGMSTWRLFGNWVLTFLTKVSSGNWKIKDPQNGYTAITRRALRKIDLDKVYPGYGYCNDLLVRLNVAGYTVRDVPIPARYRGEKSKIKYGPYIVRLLLLLTRLFIWRMKVKKRRDTYEFH